MTKRISKSVFGGQYVYYYDFPTEVELDFSPLAPEDRLPILIAEDDSYTIETNRFLDYVKKIKVECDDKMAWVIGAVRDEFGTLEDVISTRQLCEYCNTSDYWKKGGEWPQEVNDEQLSSFNMQVFRNWLFQKTVRYFYSHNPDALPGITEYKRQLQINLKQFKQEIFALNALQLIESEPETYIATLWESVTSNKIPDRFNVINISSIKEIIKEYELIPDGMPLCIHPDDFEYWQQIHRKAIDELTIIINGSIMDGLKKKSAELCSDISFEQLYATYWPNTKRFDDNTLPLRSVAEINEFMEKISLLGQQRSIMIEQKRKEWKGSPTGFDVALERAQSALGSQKVNSQEFIQLLAEELKKVAEEDDALESLSLVNTNPTQVVAQILNQEGVDNVVQLAPVIVRDIQHVIEHMGDKLTLADHSKNAETLDQFVVNVRSACNREALIDLYERLEKSTSKEMAEKIISNWDIIGTDIRDSVRMMTESDKNRIIAYAEGKMTKERYQQEMAKLNVKLNQGEITAQEEVVIKMFPKLKQALMRLPKEYFEDFSLVLKRAFVHQQITHPEKFLQNPHEVAVFSAFGLDPSKVKANKELVQQKIKHVIQNAVLNGQAENEIPTLKELQHQIELMALKEKIIAAGGESSLAPVIYTLTKARQEIIKLATNLLEQEYEKCKKKLIESNENIPQHIDRSLRNSKNKVLSSLYRFIDKKIKENKDRLLLSANEFDKVKDMISPLDEKASSKMKKIMLDSVQKDIEFFKLWGNPIQYENIQGFIGGEGEVLGNGVCQANTYRIITREMTSLARNQPLSNSQWGTEVKISLQDRFNQALYQVDTMEKNNNNGLPQAVLKRLHLKKIQPLHNIWRFADESAFASNDIYQALEKAVGLQHKSKLKNYGIIKLSIGHHPIKKDKTQDTAHEPWGHAIYFRYDPERKIAYFYDPNHGRSINFYNWKKLEADSDFKKMRKHEQDEAVLNYMLLCFSQMIANDFDDINDISCYEMEMNFNALDKLVSAGNKIIGGLNNFFKKPKEKEADIKIEPMREEIKRPLK
ncbi:TPA: hypothetical protein JAN90_04045 [Legionella pneumophila]|uniref:hypothetical protein n=1 Tax=Legionella TaxID=445 RepID=UPI0007787220|nr:MULTISPECIES: hypothetical protein [Legionella]HAT7071957.1 hypothetical protein [Legionella pneumophila]HAT8859676.1 hypothetical protein [Legionella pneumophila subsp. pneumophila]MCW8394680.1 hypothetical protein [Legionella sp. PATHC039]HAT8640377.1 hypothetical protein [Legionella pneumophila]HAT8867057.1 hypothetical protein [Legionella pneumophila subsp. pneumophila]